MQTLKSAIVVVLLLTVTYSAYVALTAPPAELPPELKQIVEASGGDPEFDLAIDAGIPSSLGEENPLPPPLDPSAALDPAAAPGLAVGGYPGGTGASAHVSDDPTRARLSDENHAASSYGPSSTAANDASGYAASPQSLPTPDPSAAPVAADPTRDYPTTAEGDLDLNIALPGAEPAGGADVAASTTPATDPPSAFTLPGEGTDSASGADLEISRSKLANAIATADRQCEQQKLREALATLSVFYNTPELTAEDRQPLLARLDFLAGEVIYSTRHLLEQPYRVAQGETLKSIAASLEVPWQLLGMVNGVDDPAAIVPGQELKAIRGPFRAEVSLDRKEMTLFLGELYAGRFPVNLGTDPTPVPGSYEVLAKETERTYYPLSGAHIPGGDPRNPYGGLWIDLGQQMCIHGSPESGSGSTAACIGLRPADAKDVAGILSQGSQISILR